jgi:copper(I)-binding protein
VNRFALRSVVIPALAACGLTLGLTACSAGQIAQTSVQEAAVNGVSAGAGDIALRNVHLRAPQQSDYVRPGAKVELLFVAANNSPDQPDRLVSIRSDVGSVPLQGDTTVPPTGVLVAGEPDGQIAALESVDPATPLTIDVSLTKPISNGLTYPFTFTFQRSGDVTVQVPISAGESPRRGDGPAGEEFAEGESPQGEHGGQAGGHAGGS